MNSMKVLPHDFVTFSPNWSDMQLVTIVYYKQICYFHKLLSSDTKDRRAVITFCVSRDRYIHLARALRCPKRLHHIYRKPLRLLRCFHTLKFSPAIVCAYTNIQSYISSFLKRHPGSRYSQGRQLYTLPARKIKGSNSGRRNSHKTRVDQWLHQEYSLV
jgi:hypothetical protein